jgi:hypothetical protein
LTLKLIIYYNLCMGLIGGMLGAVIAVVLALLYEGVGARTPAEWSSRTIYQVLTDVSGVLFHVEVCARYVLSCLFHHFKVHSS